MTRYVAIVAGVVLALLALFAGAEALGLAPPADPVPWLAGHPAAAALGVGLLVGDVLLPVPSSAVMVAHGALFGVWRGCALSLLGGVCAAALAFWLGTRGSRVLDRLLSPGERRRADALLARWGGLAILLSRPVPIAAEAVALLAGASGLRFRELLVMSALGTAPAALLYALAGAAAWHVEGGPLVLVGVVLLAGAALWLRRRPGTLA